MTKAARFPILTALIMLAVSVPARNDASQTARYSPYYYQKKSLFEILPNTPNEIIFLGDSITDGGDWSELFNDDRMKNRGIDGDVTDGVLARLSEVTESHPRQIFLLIGINDLSKGRSVDYIVENIRIIAKKITQTCPKTDLYLQGLLPVNADLGQFPDHTNKTEMIIAVNRKLEAVAERFGATYLDLFSAFADGDNKLDRTVTNDGLHLTGNGYLRWKSLLKKHLDSPGS